jgi:hypothetical protein
VTRETNRSLDGARAHVVVIGLLALAMLLAFAGAARANIVVGSTLSAVGNNTGVDCGTLSGDCVLAPANRVASPTLSAANGVSPVNGTVVRWGVRLLPGAPYVRLRIIRSVTFAGTGIVRPSPPAGVDQFPESLPISVGDRIAVEDPGPGYVLVQTGQPSGYTYQSFGPGPDGSALGNGAGESRAELLLNAEVQPSNAFTVGNGNEPVLRRLSVPLSLPNPGTLTVTSVGKRRRRIVRSDLETFENVGGTTTTLRFGLTSAGERALKQEGKAKGGLIITYTPTDGTPAAKRLTLSLRRRSKK